MASSAIRWTTETRRQLHGWRHPDGADPADAAPSLAEAWEQIRTVALPAILGSAAAAGTALRKSHAQRQPPKRLEVDEELLRASLVFAPPSVDWDAWESWRIARALVALWTEVGGFRFAVDVLSAQPAYSVVTSSTNGVVTGLHVDREDDGTGNARGPWTASAKLEPLWWALRCRVSTMTEAELGRSCIACKDLLDGVPAGDVAPCASMDTGGHWWRRAMLVFVLSRNTTLAAEQIDRLLDAVGDSEWGGAELLVAAAPDARRAEAVAARAIASSMLRLRHYAIDIVEALGLEARPVLETAYEHARAMTAAKYLLPHAEALKLARGEPLRGQGAEKKRPGATKQPAAKIAAKKPIAAKQPVAAKKLVAKKPVATKKKPVATKKQPVGRS